MKHFKGIPPEISKEPIEFLKWLKTSAIIEVGEGDECIVVSCLMHGIEPSGYYAFHETLQKLQGKTLKKKVYFMFLNVRSALVEPIFSKRYCDDESDLNRIWSARGINTEQNRLVEEIKEFFMVEQPSLFVDFHNTTGESPVFTCVSVLDKEILELVSHFSDRVLHYEPKTTIMGWAQDYTKAFTLECGKSTEEQSTKNAKEFLDKVLILGGVIDGKVKPITTSLQIMRDSHPIKVNPDCSIAFGKENTGEDLVLRPDIDQLNLQLLPKGTVLGWENKPKLLDHKWFDVVNNELRLSQDTFFIGFTPIIDVIKKDALTTVVTVERMDL